MGKRKYNFNQNYFDQINTPTKAYILGFIGADGNNNKDGFRIELHKKDFDILEKIQHQIGESKLEIKGNRCGLWYYSRKMSNKLSELGIIPNKTHFFDFIETGFDKDFIRGYFDGDGSIFIDENNYNRASITITGNDLIINRIKNIIDNKFDLNGYTYTRNKNTPNIITLNYCGTNSCSQILDWLYNGSEIYLDRKFKLYKQVMEVKQSQLDRIQKNKDKIEREKKNKEENIRLLEEEVVYLLNNNYSIRQIHIQHGIDKRKVRRIIEKTGYKYPTRRRMFFRESN